MNRKNVLQKMEYYVLHPLVGKEYLSKSQKLKAEGYTEPLSTNHAILITDFRRVDQCDILHVDFTNSKNISIGTVSEISRAFTKDKLIITVLPKNNIHNHAFIKEMS